MTEPSALPPGSSRLSGIFQAEQDRALGRLAVERRLVTEKQVEEASQGGRPLAEELVARGWVNPPTLEDLRRALGREDFLRVSLLAGGDLPPEALTAADDPVRQVAEFILVSSLGRGGAGEVWKAWDRSLRRWVALKRPASIATSKTMLDRFQREAEAVAKLTHPNIVPVYRVGEDRERPYIVFQLIEGDTLNDVKFSIRESVDLLRTVALAVDHAHRQGIVHRDLKPGNIMRDSEGKVWILDFGLAYLGGSDIVLTATGAVIGTPSYMSPEQAGGKRSAHDRGTDIYSLGATLFHLVTGRPPFEGDEFVGLVHRVAQEDPPRPGALNPGVPRDLETILQKAMNRDAFRRYPTAADLAEDLGRFLAGEPISARPTNWTQRIVRTVRRSPATWGIGATVLLGLAAVGFLTHRYTREREVSLATVRETARLSLNAALQLRRSGQNAGMKQFLPPLENAYRQAIDRGPGLAEPDYQMGRFCRAVLDEAAALEYQERALGKDPEYSPSRYERAILLSKVYGRGFRRASDSLRTLDPARATKASRDAVEAMNPDLAATRGRIQEDCENLQKAGGIEALACRGILAFHQELFADARKLLDEAIRQDPSREEVWEARAGAAAAEVLRATGLDGKLRWWAEAEDFFGRGVDRDRGYLPHLLRRGEVRLQRGKYIRQFGRDPLPDYALAEGDFTAAIGLDALSAEAWLRRGEERAARAIHEAESGREPFAFHATSEEDLSRAISIDPKSPEVWMRRGLVRTNRAVFRGERRLEAEPDFEAADADFARSLSLDASYTDAWHWRGIERANRAMSLDRKDREPMKVFGQAESDLDQALKLRRDAPGIWLWKGICLSWSSQHLKKMGENPSELVSRAEQCMSRAIEIDQDYADAYFWRALLRFDAPDLGAAAEKDFLQVLGINSNRWEAHTHLAMLEMRRGDKARGEEARDHFRAAKREIEEAIRINPAVRESMKDALERARRGAER